MSTLHRYRVRVEVTVLVEAGSNSAARAKGEVELRKAVDRAYIEGGDFADGLEEFRYRARKAERLNGDE